MVSLQLVVSVAQHRNKQPCILHALPLHMLMTKLDSHSPTPVALATSTWSLHGGCHAASCSRNDGATSRMTALPNKGLNSEAMNRSPVLLFEGSS